MQQSIFYIYLTVICNSGTVHMGYITLFPLRNDYMNTSQYYVSHKLPILLLSWTFFLENMWNAVDNTNACRNGHLKCEKPLLSVNITMLKFIGYVLGVNKSCTLFCVRAKPLGTHGNYSVLLMDAHYWSLYALLTL